MILHPDEQSALNDSPTIERLRCDDPTCPCNRRFSIHPAKGEQSNPTPVPAARPSHSFGPSTWAPKLCELCMRSEGSHVETVADIRTFELDALDRQLIVDHLTGRDRLDATGYGGELAKRRNELIRRLS